MDSPSISIIIPIYNVANYLCYCIDNILIQDFANWELILIDDGSTDASGDICDSYAKKDIRIKVFHQENAGVSAARNKGIHFATGNYVWFVDADDVILKGALTTLYDFSETNKLDCVQFAYVKFETKVEMPVEVFNCKTLIYEDLNQYFQHYVYGFEVWRTFIQRNIISQNALSFLGNVKYAEDLDFVLRVLAYANRIATLSDSLYGYRIERSGQAMKNISINNASDNLIVAEGLIDLYLTKPNQTGDFLLVSINHIIRNYFLFIAKSKCSFFDYVKLWRYYIRFYKITYMPIYRNKECRSRILQFCVYFPFLYIFYLHIKSK